MYRPGQVVDLTEATARRLIAINMATEENDRVHFLENWRDYNRGQDVDKPDPQCPQGGARCRDCY